MQAELALLADQRPGARRRLARARARARAAHRGRRPEAVDLPLPPRRHRRLRRRSTTARSPAAHERISTNFRSNPRLLKALNAVFDKVFEQQPGIQPANVELTQPPDAPAAKRPPIVLVVEAAARDCADDLRREEAKAIAALLHRRTRGALGDPRPPRGESVAAVPVGRHGDPDAGAHRDRALRGSTRRRRDPVPARGLARLLPAPRGARPDLGACRNRRPDRPPRARRRASLERVRDQRRGPRAPPRGGRLAVLPLEDRRTDRGCQ